jgi:hypothetical protein
MIFPVPERVAAGAVGPLSTQAAYEEACAAAIADPDAFWLAIARARVAFGRRRSPTRR